MIHRSVLLTFRKIAVLTVLLDSSALTLRNLGRIEQLAADRHFEIDSYGSVSRLRLPGETAIGLPLENPGGGLSNSNDR